MRHTKAAVFSDMFGPTPGSAVAAACLAITSLTALIPCRHDTTRDRTGPRTPAAGMAVRASNLQCSHSAGSRNRILENNPSSYRLSSSKPRGAVYPAPRLATPLIRRLARQLCRPDNSKPATPVLAPNHLFRVVVHGSSRRRKMSALATSLGSASS